MGIEKFFNSLIKVEKIKSNGIILGLKEKILSNFVYIDSNSVVHNISGEIEYDINYLLYSILLYMNDSLGSPLDEITLRIVEKYSFNLSGGITLENFKSSFSKEILDEIVLRKIKEHIIYITTKLINPDSVKIINISFDGIPQMSKIVEQKKRRYNGYLVGELRNKIYNETKDSFSNIRKMYEQHKIGIDRGRITTRANLMERIAHVFASEIFKNEIKSHHPLLEQVIVSNANVYGEGEKKIMEHILELGREGTYTIYSPDSDVVILGLICLNRLESTSNVNVLRFNQQSEEYDFVDIYQLRTNILEMVITYTNSELVSSLNIINVTDDIAFLFTLFGNDFLPKIEAIDARNDIETLIHTYCEYINTFKVNYLIFYQNGYRIKYYDKYSGSGLIGYINMLAEKEESLLKETYMAVTYKNYRWIKTILGTNKLLPILQSYIPKANQVFQKLKEIVDSYLSSFIKEDMQIMTLVTALITSQAISIDVKFMKEFLIFERRKDNITENDPNLEQLYAEALEKKVISAIDNAKVGKKYYFGKLRLDPYDTGNIYTTFHEKNIKDTLPHPTFEITDFEKNTYKLERKMDEYQSKLNSTDFQLGNTSVRSMLPTERNGNTHYALISSGHLENVTVYYQTFFGVTLGDRNIATTQKLQNIVREYVQGLIWIFDFYFNKNNSNRNISKVSTWMYSYHRAPLLFQIRQYIGLFKLGDMITEINNSYVNRQNYLNTLEHYMYITPKNKMVNIPEPYMKFAHEHPDFFPDLTESVNKIWTGENASEIIDCKRINFLNKCNLLKVKHITYNEYFYKISKLRSIDTDYPTLYTNNIIHTYLPIAPLIGGYVIPTGNSDVDVNKLKYYKNYFKLLYMKTGIIKYKKYYKTFKNKLDDYNK
jgi:5'-3' exonuclease